MLPISPSAEIASSVPASTPSIRAQRAGVVDGEHEQDDGVHVAGERNRRRR